VAASAPRRLAWLAVAALGLVMMLGNIVSATGSGLGCPDWPLCHGRLIPPPGAVIWTEFRHRLAVPLFSVLLVATAVVTLRRASGPGLRRVALALLALLGIQVALGAATVLLGLSAAVSTVHLVTALTILALLLVVCASGARPLAASPELPRVRRLATAGLAALLVQLVLGGLVRHTGAGLACPDFPLCAGDVVPAHALGLLHAAHRWLGVALLGALVPLARAARASGLRGVGIALGALALVQVALGIATVLGQLQPGLRAAHAAGGYALWGLLVWITLRAGRGAGARALAHEGALGAKA
jgi:heme A synthase